MKTRTWMFATLLLIACAPLALAQGTYTQIDYPGPVESYVFGRMDVATGTLPNGIVTADFNSDSKQDFAVANFGDNTVSIFLQQPNGTFARTNYTVGSEPIALAVADFNADGHPDLVVVDNNCSNNICGRGFVSVLINRGNGTFMSAVPYPTRTTNPVAVVVGDFNGDGKSDLAISSATPINTGGAGSVSIFLNQGNGTFLHKGIYAAGTGVGQLVAFNPGGNGTPSLAVTNAPTLSSGSIVVLRGNGDGSFQAPVFYTAGALPNGIATADLNGDGNPDLTVTNGAGNSVSIFLGRSDGTFAGKVDYPVPEGPNKVTTGDLNGDHKLDLIVTAGTSAPGGGAAVTLLGNGDGTFQSYLQYLTGNNPISIVVADFNGDGYLDVAFNNGDVYRVSVLLGNGDGTFPVATDYSTGTYPVAVAAGDLNGVQLSDLIVANFGDNTVSVYLNNGNGTFSLGPTYSVGSQPLGIAVSDLNRDHKLDLVVTNSGDNTISVLLGNGDGTFQPQTTYSVGAAPYGLAVSDLNGDHKPDVVVANVNDSTISVLLGNGDGTFQPQTTYVTGAGPSSVAIADLNGDGMPDLAVADSQTPIKIGESGLVSVFLNMGNGAFGNKTDYAAGYNPQSVVAVDLNGDGKQDLALATNLDTTGFVAILIGNGDGTFQSQTTYQEGFLVYALVAGDFNHDGHPDLAVTSSENNTMFILAGDGQGRFRTQGTYGTDYGPYSIAAGDFHVRTMPTGPDLVVANEYSYSLSVFLNVQLPH